MKKAFDQTFRDIKRGVNKKVLKVPSIEQKVLDATSNEPWGPHGTHLADIAQASRNYHEYQMIMTVVWKRINDTGKNWRHVYKALTILDYLVANGSERVIDDIREHAYQITTLSSFQYIDSTGRDQGSNVRKKSQSLVALVNDKERIQEAREKAAANREKFRTTGGGMNRPYDDDRYGSRDEDHNNGYGREKEWGDDRYGRDGGRYGEDGYRDDEYRGRSQSVDGDYGPRSRSSDRDRERASEDDGHHSSRGSNARAEDGPLDGSRHEPKLSEQNLGAPPPTYEDAVGDGRSPVHSKRDGEPATAFASNPQETVVSIKSAAPTPPPPAAATPPPAAAAPPPAAVTSNKEDEGFDLFDPRGAFAAAPPAPAPAPGGAEMDLFGSLSDSFGSDALALVPSTSEPHATTNSNPGQTFMAASGVSSQPFDDPFGDGPFRAVPSTDGFSAQPPPSPFTANGEPPNSVAPTSGNYSGFGDTFDPTIDILADILPPTGPSQTAFQAQPDQLSTQSIFSSQTTQPSIQTGYAPQASHPSSQTAFPAQPNQTTFPSSFPGPFGQPSFPSQGGPPMPHHGFQPQGAQSMLQPGFSPQGGQPMPQPGFSPQGGQPMPQPGFPAQGGNQPMPQPGFPAQGGNQPMTQPGFQGQGGNQPMPQQPFPAQGGNQPMPQPGFPAQNGNQPMQQPAFPAQGGNQPMQQPAFPAQGGNQPMQQSSFPAQGGNQPMQQSSFPAQGGNQPMPQSVLQPGFLAQGGQSMLQPGFAAQGGNQPMPQPGFAAQGGQSASLTGGFSQAGFSSSNGHAAQPNNLYGGFQPQGSSASNFYQQQPQPQSALTGSTGALALVPQQAAKEKFETKSTVWADTLNRGLVNLNISGSKTNPLSDIGIDFEAINRKEKRMEKPSKTPVTSNVTMGKAMGSGTGMGRAGAGTLRATPNPMVGPGMGITTMGAPGPRPGFGAPGYGGGVNQPMGMNHMQQNMGMGMNIGQGFQMQQPPAGFPPGSAMPANYNPMLGRGAGYGQQPYGGYR